MYLKVEEVWTAVEKMVRSIVKDGRHNRPCTCKEEEEEEEAKEKLGHEKWIEFFLNLEGKGHGNINSKTVQLFAIQSHKKDILVYGNSIA